MTRTCSALLLASLLLGGCTDHEDQDEVVRLGVLLPFTGRTGGPAHSFERAVLTAHEQLGATFPEGRRLEVVFADTHSSVERGMESAQWLWEQGAVAIIGAESDELAAVLRPELAARGVALISPNVSALADESLASPWFRIAPSTAGMGDNLAKKAVERGAHTVAILRTSDRSSSSFADAFAARLVRVGGTISVDITLPDDRQSYSDLLAGLGRETHVLLAAPAEVAARVVNDVSALGAAPIWFLPPALRTEVFLRNTVPGALVGSLGVTPNLEMDPDYAALYARLWDGDPPLDSGLFYYDAAALFALGYASAVEAGGGATPTSDGIASALFAVARSYGIQTRWNELVDGVQATAAGVTRYYRGLTGPIVFDKSGQREFGQPELWTVGVNGELLDAN